MLAPDVQARWNNLAEQGQMIDGALARAKVNQQANARGIAHSPTPSGDHDPEIP